MIKYNKIKTYRGGHKSARERLYPQGYIAAMQTHSHKKKKMQEEGKSGSSQSNRRFLREYRGPPPKPCPTGQRPRRTGRPFCGTRPGCQASRCPSIERWSAPLPSGLSGHTTRQQQQQQQQQRPKMSGDGSSVGSVVVITPLEDSTLKARLVRRSWNRTREQAVFR